MQCVVLSPPAVRQIEETFAVNLIDGEFVDQAGKKRSVKQPVQMTKWDSIGAYIRTILDPKGWFEPEPPPYECR